MITHMVSKVIGYAKKLLQIAFCCWDRYIIDTVFLILRELNPIMSKFMTYKFHFGIAEVDFVRIEGYLMFSKSFEYKFSVFK